MSRQLVGSRRDPRDVANYTLEECARWIGVPSGILGLWLGGKQAADASRGGVVVPAQRSPLGLSFWNLVECAVVASIRREHKVSLQKLRSALRFVRQQLGKPRPLIEQDFATDGVDLFVEVWGRLVSASENGQLRMKEALLASLHRVERDEQGLAARLYPWHRSPTGPRVVTVDPRVSFGRPVLAGTGVTVEVVLDRFFAGDDVEVLAGDYAVPSAAIQELVRWGGGSSAA